MGAINSAFGMEPVNLIGGQPYAGSFRQLPIASTYGTNIFHGDIVALVAGGTIERQAVTSSVIPVGVFMGCSYTDATMGFIQRNYWPASTIATDAYGYICDDPDALFKVQADATLGVNAVGMNAAMINGTGSTATGRSANELQASSIASTNTLPLRIVDFWDRDEIDTAFPVMIVKFNEGDTIIASSTHHQYRSALGNAAS